MARPLVNWFLAGLALAAIGAGLWHLEAARDGVVIEPLAVDEIPARLFRPAAGAPGPTVVVAHGFAGSQQLMESFALALARNGYCAVTFDFAGHGRNPRPLTGSITEVGGATRRLVDDVTRVAARARSCGDGRLAVLGHSMASDIVVRFAEAEPTVAATVAVSMFSPAVTATAPRNLLVIVGDWEGMLKTEALRVVGLVSAPAAPEPAVTYGDIGAGTARRAAFSSGVEHVAVLYSRDSLREAVGWLDAVFGIARDTPPVIAGRGPWIVLLLAGVVLLARPLSGLLPVVTATPAGSGLSGRRLWAAIVIPAVVTPLLLRLVPTHFLPVLVGDYLAAHFAAYGVLTVGCMAWAVRGVARPPSAPVSRTAFAVALAAVVAFGFVGLVWPIDRFAASFVPGPGRLSLVVAMLVGTLAFFLADEWLTRGAGTPRWAYGASKLAFVISLALAVGLDFGRLFFLVIIVPVIVLFFLVHGLISTWAYRSTGHPFVGAIANAVAFAWAIGVTFPLLAG